MKLKSLWCSIFQVQNTYMISKSMKHIDSTSLANEDDINEYRIRREKNNESVRKSRAKNRMKLQECASHVQELKRENNQLNKHLEGLQAELFTLKGLFQHCFSFNLNNLAIKPTEIPTSALYNIIMKKELTNGVPAADSMATSTSSTQQGGFALNETNNDQFYIDQIKNALHSIRQESQQMPSMNTMDHELSVAMRPTNSSSKSISL